LNQDRKKGEKTDWFLFITTSFKNYLILQMAISAVTFHSLGPTSQKSTPSHNIATMGSKPTTSEPFGGPL
jgi:hypothetical protein